VDVIFIRITHSPEPPLPPGFPKDVPLLNNGKVAELYWQSYLLRFDRDNQITVEFEGRTSVRGMWSGSNASFLVTAPFSQRLLATTFSDSWGDRIMTNVDHDRSFTPKLVVTLNADPKLVHMWISTSASLDLVYPVSTGNGFVDKSDHLERKIQFYVISEKDLKLLKAYNRWEGDFSLWIIGGWWLGLYLLIFAIYLFGKGKGIKITYLPPR
jgi:hypothetical protein